MGKNESMRSVKNINPQQIINVKIGGLQKTTLLDYPQKIACVVFLVGCSFRCPWCYSPELVLPEKIETHPEISHDEFFSFLEKRKGKLEGVVVCGGEPTIHSDLPEFLRKIKEKGYSVKLDTNGSRPEKIEEIVKKKLVDYIAMDIKAPLQNKEKYKEVTGVAVNVTDIQKSIKLITTQDIDYEFRSTLVPTIHDKESVREMAKSIEGAEKYFLQNFFPSKTLSDSFLRINPFSVEEMKNFKKIASPFVKECEVRTL
jgi:pyruvate formate lyase activating enzyme